jgi:hypothetical protein
MGAPSFPERRQRKDPERFESTEVKARQKLFFYYSGLLKLYSFKKAERIIPQANCIKFLLINIFLKIKLLSDIYKIKILLLERLLKRLVLPNIYGYKVDRIHQPV